jgi:membrane-bound lytic murein transglycosylase D
MMQGAAVSRLFALLAVCVLLSDADAAPSPEFVPQIRYQARTSISAPEATQPPIVDRLEDMMPPPEPVYVPPVPRPSYWAMTAPRKRRAAPTDVWERMRASFVMPDLTGALVARQQEAYLKRPDVLKAMFERSRRYLFHVVQELEKRGLPGELALLPMVESGYNPYALSPAQASGLWQFIPGTGRRFDLPQTSAYDARRDVVAATRAAMDYLALLYDMHGDWHLALASYNWGEHAVLRAVARNRASGKKARYETLSLPDETRLYVPKLQALKNIIANPQAFGIELAPLANDPYFVTIKNTRDIDARVAAKLAEIPLAEFRALNPGHNRSIIPGGDKSFIVLPADRAEAFERNLAEYRERPAQGLRSPKLAH